MSTLCDVTVTIVVLAPEAVEARSQTIGGNPSDRAWSNGKQL